MRIVRSDLFSVKIGLIVHGCNAQGVMGSGVALQVKEMYPVAFAAYRDAMPDIPALRADKLGRPRTGTLPMGSITTAEVLPSLWIVNAVTQFNYGKDIGIRYTSYDAIEIAFRSVTRMAYEIHMKRGFLPAIHIPQIGAGRGNGDLRAIMEIILSVVPPEVPIAMHLPMWGLDPSLGAAHR